MDLRSLFKLKQSLRNVPREGWSWGQLSDLVDSLWRDPEADPIINQVAHGFAVGDAIRYTGAAYVWAQANIEQNARTIGVVSKVIDADNFSYRNEGLINDDQFVRGKTYHLSYTTPGKIEEISTWPAGTVKQLIGHCGKNGLELEIDAGVLMGESGEVPSGVVDGENDTFYLKETPNPYTVRVYRDGEGDAIRLTPGVHYTLAGNIITVLVDRPNNIYPLYPGEQLLVFYDPFDSASEFIPEEVPTGAIDGSNKDFELTKIPDPNRMWTYKNGVHQRLSQKYTVLAAIISFIKAPFTGEGIVVDYWGALEPDGIKYNIVPTGTIDGTNTDFTLPEIPTSTMGYRNGVRVLKTAAYTVSGVTISFIDPPKVGERLLFDITF